MAQLSLKTLFARIVTWMRRPMVAHGTANTDAFYDAKRTDTGVQVSFGVGSGGTNHGVYSNKQGRWLIYGDASNVYVSSTAAGTTAVNGATVNIGNSSTSTVNVKGQALADFVVAQGTSGIFRYRKWNSGASECWGIWSGSLTHYATVGTSLFYGYHTGSVAWPSGLFNATPTVTYTAQVAQGFSTTGAELGVSSSSITLYALGTVSGTQTVTFHIHAMGKWK